MKIGLRLFHVLAVITAFILSGTTCGFAQGCRVKTTVRLLNKNAHAVSDLAPDQLRAEIDGRPAKIVAFAPGVKPVMILLIDVSSSMKEKWPQTVAAAKGLAASASGDGITLVLFRDKIVSYATGRSQVDSLLDGLANVKTAAGGTSLYDTLIDIARALTVRDSAILLISDGGDNMSHHSADQTAALFVKSGLPAVFALVLDYDQEHARRRFLNKIIADTGGLIAYPTSAPKVVAEAAGELGAEINAPYTLVMEPSKPISQAAKLKLEFVGSNGKPRRDIEIIHAAEIAGCDPVPSSTTKAD